MNKVIFKHTHTVVFLLLLIFSACKQTTINRKEVVERHNVLVQKADSLSPLTIGNGNFAFTVDITGLQTFTANYNNGILLGTQSNWGWHSYPNPQNFNLEQCYKPFEVNGRTVKYVHDYRKEGETIRAKASEWLRSNPHRMNLGTLGFKIIKKNDEVAALNDIENISQQLNMYTGCIESHFEIEGVPVDVETVCHSTNDIIGVKIQSPLLKEGKLRIIYQFNKPDANWKNKIEVAENNFNEINITNNRENEIILERKIDDFIQSTQLVSSNGTFEICNSGCTLNASNNSQTELVVSYSSNSNFTTEVTFNDIKTASLNGFQKFWESGAAVDFSACTDERAFELERRVILSQYLTQIQCSGSVPPQETGLTLNSWHGKFHMEMHWWHGVHFALWNRTEILEKQLDYYLDILNKARNTANIQGYEGARWPKMTDLKGNESPSSVGTYLVWQEPHIIYMCNMLLQQSKNKAAIFQKYFSLIHETANFMADFPVYNQQTGYYDLCPPLIPAQERFAAENTTNPAFEIAYWHYGLATAINWLEQMNAEIPEKWIKVMNSLSPLTIQNEKYLFTENAIDSYTNPRYLTDHPMVLGIWGMLPYTTQIDSTIFENTYQNVKKNWHWEETWGWDFPLAAMTAAELKHYNDAIDFLLKDETTNTYLLNGHNYQDERLPLYLPGNGALLTAVARMCKNNQFPKDGKWDVRWEE